jgi:hypothetical protein
MATKSFLTAVAQKTCMTVGKPAWRFPLATPKARAAVAPLMDAIKRLDERPFRMVSHEDEDGNSFNCSFFHSEEQKLAFQDWEAKNALTPGSQFHECLTQASEAVPSSEALYFGEGAQMLTDSRFGEYQLGMAVRYSRAVFRSREMMDEAAVQVGASLAPRTPLALSPPTRHGPRAHAGDPPFERIMARAGMKRGIPYFGRLVMTTPDENTWLTATRYGSVADAKEGKEVVKELFAQEMDRWFDSYESQYGTTSQLLEL